MNAIIGLTHLLRRDAADGLQRERLAKIDGAAQHLLQVINDILDLSKIEAGRVTLETVEFSRDELLSRALEMVGQEAAQKRLELVLDVDGLPERMRGDPKHLAQALINLLSNAVKFTSSGWVRLRAGRLADDGDRLQVRFEVQDTGVGIAPERQGALFTSFEQADSSTTRRYGGTGLGLALTRHFARLMGGEAGVQSLPGVGSTFWFTAWLERAAQAREPAGRVALPGLRALLVDDLPEAREAIAAHLEQLGLEVDAQPGGREALARARAEAAAGRAFDVMLVDWQMPAPDGLETLRALREALGKRMPASILVSSFDRQAMRQQAADLAVDAMLSKPVSPSALHDALVAVLRRPAAAAVPPRAADDVELTLRGRHAGQRLLLAEDNAINREVAEELLRGVGLVVESAEDGAQALEMALASRFDLVLMDMQMPRLDGIAATRALRARGVGVPVIAMTANALGEDRDACLAAGMNDHVAKPVDARLLYRTLLRWLPVPGAPTGR
jgi:CheY-like chemotaxis protein